MGGKLKYFRGQRPRDHDTKQEEVDPDVVAVSTSTGSRDLEQGASTPRSLRGSVRSNASSQVSDGSIDGICTAIEELVVDHIMDLIKRCRRTQARAEYLDHLRGFRQSVSSSKANVNSHDGKSTWYLAYQDACLPHHAGSHTLI